MQHAYVLFLSLVFFFSVCAYLETDRTERSEILLRPISVCLCVVSEGVFVRVLPACVSVCFSPWLPGLLGAGLDSNGNVHSVRTCTVGCRRRQPSKLIAGRCARYPSITLVCFRETVPFR